MLTDQSIKELCARVTAAPDGSAELAQALNELREALSEHAAKMREMVARSKNAVFHTKDEL
jgi:hypothetical protein